MRCATSERRALRFGSLLALVACCWVRPSLAEVQSLAELEQRALANRASLVSERAKVRAAEAQVEMARAPHHPALAARAEAWAGPGGRLVRVEDVEGEEYRVAGSRALGDSSAFTPEPRYSASLSLSSKLYDFGRTSASVQAAEAGVGARQASVLAEQRAVVGAVRDAYLDWLSAHGLRALARESLTATELERQALEGRVAEGTSREAELASVRYDQLERNLELSRRESELESARRALERASQSRIAASAEPDYTILDTIPRAANAQADPEVRALEAERNAALNSARAEKLARAPVLSAGAEAGLAAQGSTLVPIYRVGVSLSVALLDGGLSSAAADREQARAEELAFRARSARDEAAFARVRAEAELVQGDEQVRLAGELLAIGQLALAQAEERFRLGAGPFELVTQARLRVTQAKQRLLSARVDRARARLQLAGSISHGIGSITPTR